MAAKAHRDRARLPVAPPLRPPRPLRAARALRHRATRTGPTTARWRGPTSSSAASTTPSAALGLRDDTLLVVTSDHGEGLGEHGEALHGFFVYQIDAARALPRARARASRAGTRLDAHGAPAWTCSPPCSTSSGVAPPAARALSGRSLAAALRGGAAAPSEPRPMPSRSCPLLHFGWSDLRVLREGRFKYIQAPRPELYDLASDPGELTQPRWRAEPARAEAHAGGARARARRGAQGRRAPAPAAAPFRRSCSRSWAPSATWAAAAPRRRRRPGPTPRTRSRSSGSSTT